jgi:hypothetical protein
MNTAHTPSLRSLCGLLAIMITLPLTAQDFNFDWKNGLSAQIWYNKDEYNQEWLFDTGWKPDLFAKYQFENGWDVSGELSLNNHVSYLYDLDNEDELDLSIKLYRAWAAMSYGESEIKAGLQHIRFGPAKIYRPLQWFDNLDPFSLIQDSEGVPAITVTHFFPNPEFKFWILPGTGEPRYTDWGVATKKGSIEWGGRASVLSTLGETGLSFNTRTVKHAYDQFNLAHEYQFGLDQRVDGVIGAWLETDVRFFDSGVNLYEGEGFAPLPRYYGSATIGADYTFGIGNGLYIMGEAYYYWDLSYHFICKSEYDYSNQYSGAIVLKYPLGLLDTIQIVSDVSNSTFRWNHPSIMLSWRRVYDKLSWDVALKWVKDGIHITNDREYQAKLTVNYDF